MKNKSILLIFIISLFFSNSYAQPANDGCSGAINLGSLPTPGACTSGLQNGAVTTVAGTTVGATADNPFVFQTGCQGSSANMNAPSIDVWYRFVATGTKLNISVTGFPNANVGLWSGTCGNLGGYNCSVGTAGGTTTLTATQIQIGATYYISIGGNTDTQTSTFSLSVDNDIDCNNCLRQSSITANPLPVNGAYSPGETVQFCYTITEWQIQNTNWFHGVQISMGSGWTGAITGTTVPAACQGSGTWVFMPTGIGTVNGTSWGPGFYFETTSGGTTNPANNFGDNCSGTGLNWTFCFTLTVDPGCSPGSDLGVDVNTSGDGESGSWSSAGCSGDYATTFNAIGTCCPPTMTSTATCINASTGTATATPVGSAGPYDYEWSPGGQTTQTATGLAPGTYTVSLTDANLCERFATVTVASNPLPAAPTTAPVTYCQNAAAVALTATASAGCTLNWYGTDAVGGTASATAPTPGTTTVGTTTYYVSQTSAAGCEGPRASIVVTVNATPVVTVNSPTICPTVTAVLTATGATTYVWDSNPALTANPYSVTPASTTSYTVTGTTSGCSATATATVTVASSLTVNVNSPTICAGTSAVLTATGATTYEWDSNPALTANPYTVTPAVTTSYTIVGTAGGCTGSATATVTVNPLPAAPGTAPVVYCENATAVELTATAAAGSTLNWYGTNAVGGTASATAPTPVTSVAGTTTYYVSQTSAAGCEGPRASILVTVDPLPVAPTTAPVIYCLNDVAAALTATAAGGNTLNWYGTNATGGSASATAPTPVTTTAGTVTYYVSQSTASGCEGPRASILVTVNDLPVIGVNSPTICPSTSATLTATGGVSYSWDSGVSTVNPYTVSPAVTTTYTVVGTDGNGCSASEVATVTVLGNLVITVNSPDICDGETAILTATGGTTYSWDTGASIGVSTTNPYSVTPAVTTTYTVTGTTNGCTGTATATVTVNPLPVAPATAPVEYCQNDVSAALTATASAGCTLNWYDTNATGGSASSTAPTPVTTVVGTTTYYVSQTNTTTGCEGPRASLDVIVNPLPVAPLTTPVDYCQNDVAIALTAVETTGADVYTLNWYGTSATGGTGSSTAPTPNTSAAGTTTYYVSQTNSTTGCEGPRASILVTVNPLPVAPTTAPVAYCLNDVASPLSATASSGMSLNWYGTNATGGTASSTAPTPLTTTVGTVDYYVSQTDNSTGCEGPRASLSVTVNSLPAAPAVTPVSYCLNEPTVALVATALSGNFLKWYGTNATGGTASLVAPVPSSSTAGTTTYYVSQVVTSAGCESPRAPLDVVINPLPVMPLTSPVAYCLNEVTSSVSATADAGCTLNWFGTNATGGVASSIAPTPSSATPGTVTYYVSQTNTATGCEGPRAPLDVVINPLPIAPLTAPVVYCINDTPVALTATPGAGSSLNWYGTNAVGGVGSGSATVPNTSVAGTTNYYVSQTNTATGCEGPRASILVTVNALTVPVFTQVNAVCQGAVAPVLPVPSSNNPSISGGWTPTISTATAGTTTYTFTPNPGQCAATTTMQITINPLPVIIITDPLEVCEPLKVDITSPAVTAGSSGLGPLTYWSNSTATVPLATPNAVDQSGIYYIQSVTSLGCTDVQPVNVLINSTPIAEFDPSPAIMSMFLTESTMINNSINAVSYLWDFGDDSQSSTETSPIHTFPDTDPGNYTITLIATSVNGCVDTAYATVTVNGELIYYVPNTFTPDGDNFNETFQPVFTAGHDPYVFTLYIFDRWGDLIFESHDPKIGWPGTYGTDGIMVQDGTYTWKIVFKLNGKDKHIEVVGHVNVLH